MRHGLFKGSENKRPSGAGLYDRLECALIACQYALADARSAEDAQSATHERAQEALLSAGEEVQDVLLLLKTAALSEAAARVREWG